MVVSKTVVFTLGVLLIGIPFLLLPVYEKSNIRDLEWRDINFLHTTDTHGWYSGHRNQPVYSADWGDFVSFTAHMKQLAALNGQDLLVVDTGDRHDGNGLSDITVPNGARSLPIFVKEDYDLITIGNHELYLWENSKQEYEIVVKAYGDKYVCSNVEYETNGSYVPFGHKYRYFTTPVQGTRVLSFAFLFDFTRNNDKTRVTPLQEVIKEEWFLDVLADHQHDVDILVVFGHIPVAHEWRELYVLHEVLRTYFPTTKIQYFGGHSHIRDFTVFDANSTGLQSGRFCETVGFVGVDLHDTDSAEEAFHRRYIDFNLDSFLHHTRRNKKEFDTKQGTKVSALLAETREDLGLERVIGTVNTSYYMDYVPMDHPKSLFRFLSEEVLPTLPYAPESNEERVIIINSGSVRYDLYKGPYTIDTEYIVSPFRNDWVHLALPKSVANKVAGVLNRGDFIANTRLLPLHQQHMQAKQAAERNVGQQLLHLAPVVDVDDVVINHNNKLSKGYVTVDDFGTDGDDTPHKPVVTFPVNNVVESRQLKDDSEATVDLVFYTFITKNVLDALDQLHYNGDINVEFYSNVYLGQLLSAYVKSSSI